MPDENKQTATVEAKNDAAPVAPAAKAGENAKVTASPKQDSAPVENKRGSAVEPEKGAAAASDKADAKEVPAEKKAQFEFIRLRKEKKEAKTDAVELAKRLEAAEARLKELSEQKPSPKTDEDKVSAFLENPEKFLEDNNRRVVNDVLAAIESSKREDAYVHAASEAEKWLLTRSHVGDPAFAEDVKAHFEKYRHLAEAGDPISAAKLSYLDVCSSRGVEPDLGYAKKDTSAMGTIGVRPSASDSIGPIQRSDKQWRAYVEAVRPDSPDYRSRLNEWMKAQKEGRA